MTFDPGPVQSVDVEPDGDRWTLSFSRTYPHPPDVVWAALTHRGEHPFWAPYQADRDLDSVGPAVLVMQSGDVRTEFDGTVSEVDPPYSLQHAFGDDVLRWELTETAGGTSLTLRHTLTDRAQAPMTAAGWHLCLLGVDEVLAGTPRPAIAGMDAMAFGWESLHEQYARRLRIDISRVALPGVGHN